MKLLSDSELITQINVNQLLAGYANLGEQVKGCSLDLSIGEIFQPGIKKGKPGSIGSPRTQWSLSQGETVVIRTAEKLKLGLKYAAIVFPANRVSLRGLLMTNPGHVDPGYDGPLHVTAINMGKEPFILPTRGRLLRVLVVELDKPASKPIPQIADPITNELLSTLSADFLDIEDRAKSAAKKEIEKSDRTTRLLQITVPLLIAIVGALITWSATTKNLEERLVQIEMSTPRGIDTRVNRLESIAPLQSRLNTLERETFKKLDDRIDALERARRKP